MAGLLVLLAIAAIVPRFARLGADFPTGVTSSEAPYTDEGWYSNSAVRHFQRGLLFVEHDVNEASVMPLFHLTQRLGFAAGGMSFRSARAVAQILFLGVTATIALVLLRASGAWAAAIGAGLLLTNFTLFSYSRLALVELPMLLPLALGLLLIHRLPSDLAVRRGTIAGGAVAAAALFKISALFAGPVFLLVAVLSGHTRRARASTDSSGSASARPAPSWSGCGNSSAIERTFSTPSPHWLPAPIDLKDFRSRLPSGRL